MIGPNGLFEEWLKPGPRVAPGPGGVIAARVILLIMLAGAVAALLLVRWYIRTARRRDHKALRRMQRILIVAMWVGFLAGMGGYFWYCYSLLPRP